MESINIKSRGVDGGRYLVKYFAFCLSLLQRSMIHSYGFVL